MKHRNKMNTALEPLFDEEIPNRWAEIEAQTRKRVPMQTASLRKKQYGTAIAAAVCAAIVVVGAGIYLTAGEQRPVAEDFSAAGSPAPETDSHLPSGTGSDKLVLPPTSVPETDRIVIHELEDGVAGMPLPYDEENMYTEWWELDQVLTYLGQDIRVTALPSDMAEVGAGNRQKAIFFRDGTMVPYACYNEFGFYYAGREKERPELTRRLKVDATWLHSVPGDVLYLFEEDMELSVLAGVDTHIGHCRVGLYDGGKEPVGWYDRYVAQFSLDGLAVQVVAENLTAEEFLTAVRSIVA